MFYSAFMIGDGKLLTNAHCVEHGTQVNQCVQFSKFKFNLIDAPIIDFSESKWISLFASKGLLLMVLLTYYCCHFYCS